MWCAEEKDTLPAAGGGGQRTGKARAVGAVGGFMDELGAVREMVNDAGND